MAEIKALPPKDALKYWGDKVPMSSAEFAGLEASARSRAFAVAGLSRLDQVNAVHTAMTEALKNGETLASFQGRIADVIEQQGWTKHRVATIYRTNLQSAYMAGRYAQMQKAALRPYWMYSAVGDHRTRPAHAAMHGLVRKHDDPFWETHYPPNGFQCRCSVRTLSARQVKSRGLEVGEGVPSRLMYVDPRTGAETFVTPIPDKGWTGNPGKDWLAGLNPAPVGGTVRDIATQAICKRTRDHALSMGPPCTPPLANINQRHVLPVAAGDILKSGLAPTDYVKAFLAEFGLKGLNASKLVTVPGTNVPVVINKGFFIDKTSGGWKVAKGGRAPFVKLLARTILSPFEVWLVPTVLTGKRVDSLRLIRLFRTPRGDLGGYTAFNLVGGRQWQAATAFTPKPSNPQAMLKYLEKQRVGTLLYREP